MLTETPQEMAASLLLFYHWLFRSIAVPLATHGSWRSIEHHIKSHWAWSAHGDSSRSWVLPRIGTDVVQQSELTFRFLPPDLHRFRPTSMHLAKFMVLSLAQPHELGSIEIGR